MVNINKTVDRIEQGNAWEDTDEVVKLEVKKTLDKGYSYLALLRKMGADPGRRP
jgi:hypothetical protein